MKTILAMFFFGSFFFSNQPFNKSMVKKEAEQRCSCYADVAPEREVSDAPAMLPPGVSSGEYIVNSSADACLETKRSSNQTQAIKNLNQEARSNFETRVSKLVIKKCPKEYKQAVGL